MFHRYLAVAVALLITGLGALSSTSVSHAEKIGGASVQKGQNPKKKCDVRGGITLKPGQKVKFNVGSTQIGDQSVPTWNEASCNKGGTRYCEKTVVNGKTVSSKCVSALTTKEPTKLPTVTRPETAESAPASPATQPESAPGEPQQPPAATP